jgi:hypothetical protein
MRRGATAVAWMIGLGALAAHAAIPYARAMMSEPAVAGVRTEVKLPTIEVSRPAHPETVETTAQVG